MSITDLRGMVAACIAVVALALAQASDPGRLSLDPPDARGWPRIWSESVSNHVVRIESSTDLNVWQEIGLSHTRFQAFPDPAAPSHVRRFYRGSFAPRLDSDDWKNQVIYPDDPLRSPEPGYGQSDQIGRAHV